MKVTAKRLDSGYWHIRGTGPCNWAQPKRWPCSEHDLRASMFPEACEDFVQSALDAAYADARRVALAEGFHHVADVRLLSAEECQSRGINFR